MKFISLFLLWIMLAMSVHAFDGNLVGKTCVVTGATSGIGREISLLLARHRCKVIVAARDSSAFATMVKEVQTDTDQPSISFSYLDLSSLKSVTTLVDNLSSNNICIDVLINNAGVFQKTPITTEDRLESSFQVNYLAHFLLTNKLLEKGIISDNATILNIVSERLQIFSLSEKVLSLPDGGHDWSLMVPGDAPYAQSKLMLLMYSYKLARDVKTMNKDIRIIAFHPGGVKTKIYDNLPLGLGKIARVFMSSPKDVAHTICSLLKNEHQQDVLIGTKLDNGIKKFAMSEENQDALWNAGDKIIRSLNI